MSAACKPDRTRQRDGGVPAFDMSKITTTTILSIGGRMRSTPKDQSLSALRETDYIDQLPDDAAPIFVRRVPLKRVCRAAVRGTLESPQESVHGYWLMLAGLFRLRSSSHSTATTGNPLARYSYNLSG